ncbi:hypothetical protein HMF8227_02816 [Saliniradius amylolyticus]|uniref:Regulator of sigma D n=1 Tax=Saliniradius amylolyticus TaxID=2183582 RepID=A0A2S2E6H7_9ALTE|nr:sigma D regulator [Saliniradius amylolyticus]AWL13265.1 hypothetical protein HMF8227_02816 [Saliniradius amylolyticus]
MLTKNEQAKQKWGGANQAIDNWLNERQELLVRYCHLAGLPPFERDAQALPDAQSIEDFCSLLMDYVSAGHFEVYDKVVENSKDQEKGKALADELYPAISATTDKALSFNDSYAAISDEQNLNGFDKHLSALGEAIETRLELEDQLINRLYKQL